MKIVHSYWSKPGRVTKSGVDKNNGGWLHKKYYYFSWALSCLKFKEIYNNIELVTDKEGYKLLVETLQLPYTSVKVELDVLNSYHEKLWAIGKLHAYRIQEEPFLHVDGDVFIWEKFNGALEKAPLVAQHREVDFIHYKDAYNDLLKYHTYIPDLITEDFKKYGRIDASNAGIFGGSDLDFFKEYVEEAFKFIDGNIAGLQNKNVFGSRFAIMYEQYLFACLARKKQLKINYLFSDAEVDYAQLSDFKNKYGPKKYTHVIDVRKKLNTYCWELENMLRAEYPEYYYHIIGRIDEL